MNDIISIRRQINDVVIDSVAQLDRAFDYESKGRRFESCRGYHDLPEMKCFLRYVQPTFIYREFNGLQLSSHLRVEGKNISQDTHLLSAGLDILRDGILGL